MTGNCKGLFGEAVGGKDPWQTGSSKLFRSDRDWKVSDCGIDPWSWTERGGSFGSTFLYPFFVSFCQFVHGARRLRPPSRKVAPATGVTLALATYWPGLWANVPVFDLAIDFVARGENTKRSKICIISEYIIVIHHSISQ